jgi:type IV pilus assembly protein PilC
MPIFGGILYKAAIARSFRTMGSLLSSGLPVLKALDLAGEVSNNEKLRRNFHMMRDAAIMGMPINLVMKEKKLFPPMISHMVAVGEETGRTDAMLEKIADWYEAELTETIKRLSSILEPVLIVFVGGIVGIMVLAIFLPIIAAIQAFM